jgi:uncharacterized protein (TIGR00369 family)
LQPEPKSGSLGGMSDPLTPHGGFADLVGYELGEWREDYAEVTLVVAERHINRSGVMHGGVLSTLIDTACGYCGTHSPEPGHRRRAFTVALTSHFIAAARLGALLTAAARRTGGGGQIFFSTCEVTDQDGRLIGKGDGVFKYLRDRPES